MHPARPVGEITDDLSRGQWKLQKNGYSPRGEHGEVTDNLSRAQGKLQKTDYSRREHDEGLRGDSEAAGEKLQELRKNLRLERTRRISKNGPTEHGKA
jgi:hypothetical protein